MAVAVLVHEVDRNTWSTAAAPIPRTRDGDPHLIILLPTSSMIISERSGP
jgi:hypothetical protein